MALCPRCLGRRFVGAIGQAAQEEAAADKVTVAPLDCACCEGRFDDLDTWLQTALDALQGFEGETFQVGTTFPSACEAAEKAVEGNPDIGDTVRTEANRLLAPRIAEATGMTWAPAERPDLVIHVDTRFWTASVSPNAVFVEGRYTKLRRDVPQTHWPCKTCQGLGCFACDDAGVQYAESVEEAVATHLEPAFEAASSSFHGAGREDIDALMMGTGRPFVLELKGPKKRQADLAAAADAINALTEASGVGVRDLRMSTKERIQELKGGVYDKVYVAHCETEAPVSAEQVEAAAQAMSGVMLEQRTPERVSHRRADLVRERRIHAMTVEHVDDERHFTVRVHADSGAYIKEMVTGDEGRTTPNLTDALGVGCRVAFLDVLEILDEPEIS